MWRIGCLVILLAGCSSAPPDPAALANHNLYLVPNNSPAQGQVAPNAPMMVVCGTNDPRNYQQNLGWGGETTPRCWYGLPRPSKFRMRNLFRRRNSDDLELAGSLVAMA